MPPCSTSRAPSGGCNGKRNSNTAENGGFSRNCCGLDGARALKRQANPTTGRELGNPFTASSIKRLVRVLWPRLEEFVNMPERGVRTWNHKGIDYSDMWRDLRRALTLMVDGEPPLDGWAAEVPLHLRIFDGKIWWEPTAYRPRAAAQRDSRRLYLPVDDQATSDRELLLKRDHRRALFYFTVMLIWHRKFPGSVNQCAHCNSYRLLPNVRQEDRNSEFYCRNKACQKARQRFQLGRTREENAAYQREHRRLVKARD